MLIALFVAALVSVFSGGGSGSDLSAYKSSIKEAVEDEAREQQAIEVVDDTEAIMVEFQESVIQGAEDLHEIHRNYKATRDEYETVVRDVLDKRHAVEKEILENREELRSLLTREEWEQVFVSEEQTVQ